MERVNIHQAKTQLSQLLHVVEQGEEVFVSQASLWEMAIKVSIGRLQGFRWLPIRTAPF